MNFISHKYQQTFHRLCFLDDYYHDSFIGVGFMNKGGWTLDFDSGCYKRYALVYVLRGTGTYTDYLGKKIAVKAGDIFRRDSVYPHSLYINPESDWLECYLTITRPTEEYDQAFSTMKLLGVLPKHTFVKTVGLKLDLVEKVYQLSEKMKISSKDEFFKLQAELLSLIAKMWFWGNENIVESREQKFVKKAKELLENSLTDRRDIKVLLNNVGTGYSNLRRIFREQTGISPGDYRIKQRINYACELLITSDEPLNIIADKLGYHDQFIFSRQFKKSKGITPSNYRKGYQL